jgi:hypothetical protein
MAAVSPLPSRIDRHLPSKDSTRVADRQLPLVEHGEPVSVDPALVHRQRSMLGAIALCMQAAGIADKEAHLALDIDAGHWSRIVKGDAHFPLDRLGPLMDLCGNEAPLEWLAHSRGYRLEPLETELQRQLREQREARESVEAENRVLRELLVGRAR